MDAIAFFDLFEDAPAAVPTSESPVTLAAELELPIDEDKVGKGFNFVCIIA